ncbi:TonB-dependent copper receptor [Solemya velum gill symbiont]|uniref:TonB-dependent copper receptor n=1 Tax=Solemya velum gill symbiont TaxID=2340 RepID=UPI0009962E58|nr:TonB-dependent copper receptor [Solemya velum gill symbiont]
MKFVMTCTATAVMCAMAQTALSETALDVQADVIDTIVITAEDDNQPGSSTVATGEQSGTRDTAEMLRDIPGVSGSRIGGHGTDPTIRGQSQNRINVLLDGAYVHGGCPNRMDPPTAYAPTASYEEITVIKGVRTLEYGGGAGGTILFNRETRPFYEDEPVRASAEAGYRSNGNIWDAAIDVSAGSEKFFGRFIGSHMEADNYEDGGGNEIRSGFEESNGTLILGFTPDSDHRLDLTLEAQRTDDLLYAGAGMDSPVSDNDTIRLKYQAENMPGMLDKLKIEAYRSEVAHVMDNYTLRTPPMMMDDMRAPSTSDTTGGRIVLEVDSDIGHWKMGVDMQNNDRDADRFNDTSGNLNSVLWPGVSIDQTGAFVELEHDLELTNRIIGGIRYDHVTSDASRADIDPPMMPMSPNQLYSLYYGATAEKRTENNWGGLLRFEHDLDSGDMLYAGISRTVRTADATEKYIASNGMSPDARWVGNPTLDPEKHHQIEAGAVLRGDKWELDASVYYTDVQDYILRDRNHNNGGNGNATIYRNVDASLYGFEASLNYQWNADWSSNFGLAYVHADNDTDDRPIAQTPPLEAVASLDYKASDWDAGARVRAAAKQTRVDDDASTGSGLDVDQTPGWAVVDLYGEYRVNSNVTVDFGVDNLFDEEYAQHLNRSSAFDPTQIQVNEPGISAWVKLHASF